MNTKTNIQPPESLVKMSKQLETLKQNIDEGFRAFHTMFPALSDAEDRFWDILKFYRKIVIENIGKSYKNAPEEFFRQTICERADGSTESGYSYTEALAFVNAYHVCKDRLYKPLFGVVTDRGDDSYGDLIDSFPLLGRKLYEQAMKKQISNVDDIVLETAKTALDKKLALYVLHGENYNGMGLNDAAQKYFPSYVRNLEDAEERAEKRVEKQESSLSFV